MNEKSYNISGSVYTRGSMGFWTYRDTETNFSFRMEFAVTPKHLREIKEKCVLDSDSRTFCKIKGKAEMDTSGKDFVLILYQIDELEHVK